MDDTLLAYLAGAMDSDGFFSIKKSTYHMRVRKDASNAVYSERCGLKQVTAVVPDLLKECFGGALRFERPGTPNSKPIYGWNATDLAAAKCVAALLPHLRIKRRQAELMLELRESKQPGYGQASYWFALEHPDWQTMELLTNTEARTMLGHTHEHSLSQALSNGSILAVPYDFRGKEMKRFPKMLVEQLMAIQGKDGRAKRMPPELVAWRERMYEEIKGLNRIGTGEHPISMRTGIYAPAAV